MNHYIVTHTFKSKEAKEAFAKAGEGMSEEEQIKNMTGENAACQMSFETPGDSLTMFCYWKANSPNDVNDMLSDFNEFFEPHKFDQTNEPFKFVT
tara:strand:+ start:751 stop:1035 length:285 start_codon:yes stop_codon:yes gene_type:complete